MAFYANRPFAIAPYMGENAFIAFTVCKVLGFRWQTALAAIFIAGVLFIVLTVLRLRQWLVEGVPTSLRYSFAVGIGLFLTFIGLNETGIVELGVAGAPVQGGRSHLASGAGRHLRLRADRSSGDPQGSRRNADRHRRHRDRGLCRADRSPAARCSSACRRASRPILWQLDLRGRSHLARVSRRAHHLHHGLCGHHGHADRPLGARRLSRRERQLPQIERPMLVDALTTCVAPAFGTTTSGAFVESATGIEAGGRTGLTVLVTGTCFLLTLFFCAVRRGHSGAGLRPGAHHRRTVHAGAHHAHRFHRLHRIHSRLRRRRR